MASPGLYATAQAHKHLPEMKTICGITTAPIFNPIVDDYYKGMATTVPFHMSQLQGVSTVQEVRDRLAAHYVGQKMVTVAEGTASGTLYGGAQAGSDCMTLVVAGNDERFTITALFDNLGKGASGAAVQNMNIMLGLDETTSLSV